jgi:hypothetical protein
MLRDGIGIVMEYAGLIGLGRSRLYVMDCNSQIQNKGHLMITNRLTVTLMFLALSVQLHSAERWGKGSTANFLHKRGCTVAINNQPRTTLFPTILEFGPIRPKFRRPTAEVVKMMDSSQAQMYNINDIAVSKKNQIRAITEKSHLFHESVRGYSITGGSPTNGDLSTLIQNAPKLETLYVSTIKAENSLGDDVFAVLKKSKSLKHVTLWDKGITVPATLTFVKTTKITVRLNGKLIE